jgi:hypothetical protein
MCYGVLEVPMKRPMLAGLVLSLAACGGGTGGGGSVPSTWSTYPLSMPVIICARGLLSLLRRKAVTAAFPCRLAEPRLALVRGENRE